MAIDDSTNYTLTGAQVKDLAARIKAGGGGGMTVYVDAPFDDVSLITNVFSDSGLTTVADWSDMADAILAGITVTAVYDNGSNKHQYVELTSVNVNDNVAVGKRFGGVLTENSGVSLPIIIFLYYDDGAQTPRWHAESVPVPTKTSDLTNDGSDGTSTYVEADDLATVATSGSYNDLTDLPSDRLYRMLVPTGTEITSNKNLNTTEFLVVGRYYCSTNNTVATLSNCPTTSAFMMDVFSPLSTTIDNETTSPWCYRLRMLTTYTGETYVQQCETTGTANVWTYHSWVRTDNIQADWNASSGLAHILNRPGIKNATAATHTDYNNNQDYIPNMRFLSFWNGAYNSGGSSNLKYFASNSVTTSNLQGGAVTTAKIAGNAVTSAKIDWGSCRSYGSGSYNTSYFSGGRIQYVKYGNMVTVTVSDLALKATPPNSTNQTTAITGLPQSASWMQNCTFNFTIYGNNTKPLTLRMDASKTAFYFHYTNGTGSSGTFNGQFTYPAA